MLKIRVLILARISQRRPAAGAEKRVEICGLSFAAGWRRRAPPIPRPMVDVRCAAAGSLEPIAAPRALALAEIRRGDKDG